MIYEAQKDKEVFDVITPIYKLNNTKIHNPNVVKVLLNHNNKVLYFAKASTLTTEKKYEMARLAYEKSIEIDSNYFDAYNNLASLYLDQALPIIEKMNNLGISAADQKQYDLVRAIHLSKINK